MDTNRQRKNWKDRKSLWVIFFLLVLGIYSFVNVAWQAPDFESGENRFESPGASKLPLAIVERSIFPGTSLQKKPKGTGSRPSESIEKPIENAAKEIPVWRKPLDDLMAVGHAGEDPAEAILALLSAQPGMGDQLLSLIMELEGSQAQQDALLVALATALTLDPEKSTARSWPEELRSLWHDRDGTILWMAELWIEGHPKAHYFQRFLQMEKILEPWHSVELATWLEMGWGEPDEQSRSRLEQLLEHSLLELDSDALAIAREWVQSEDPSLRGVALRTVGRSLASDPIAARDWVESVAVEDRIPVLESILGQVEEDQLVELIDETADLMLQNEYRGSALLHSFSRGLDLDLQELVYRRGDTVESESYRNLILYGSQGGIGRGGQIPPAWSEGLERIVQTDPALSVRSMALRICAMTWPSEDQVGFEQLIRRSDVDPRTAQMAHALLVARQSDR